MVNLKFLVNNFYLASYVIAETGEKRMIPYAKAKYAEDIKAFQYKALTLSRQMYDLIGYPTYLSIPRSSEQNYSSIGNKLDIYINDLLNSKEYKTINKQTLDSIKICEDEWNSNYEKTSKYLKEIGIELTGEFTIWMVHPGLKAGQYLRDNNISWSNQTYWSNYNTVYLWHEILHSYFGRSDYEHTLIELITDNHMKFLLNGSQYPPFVGHDRLNDFKKEAFPIWQKYINTKEKNPKNLVAEFKSAYEVFNKTKNFD